MTTICPPAKMIAISKINFAGNEERYVTEAVRSTWISSGSFVTRFEDIFGSFLGVEHAVSVCNGTCAIDLALAALRVGPGDEVIVPSLTFAASINAVLHVGATPVLADSASDHWNMDGSAWEALITPRTKAVIPVHLYGHPCDMTRILEVARAHNLFVIEDAAEAHGAEIGGKKVGTFGDIGCFSFYGNKIVTTGEGGMCVTSDAKLAERLRRLRDHGMRPDRKYWHEEPGFNFRLTNLNAAFGVAQMEGIDRFITRRAEIGDRYAGALEGALGLTIFPNPPIGKKVDWLFCGFLFEGGEALRNQLIKELPARGVDTRPTFYPAHLMPPYSSLRRSSMENAEKFGLRGFNLPLHAGLTDAEVDCVAAVVRTVLQELQQR